MGEARTSQTWRSVTGCSSVAEVTPGQNNSNNKNKQQQNNNKTTITTTKTNNNKTSSNHKEKPGSLLVMNTTSYLKRIMKMKFDQPGKEESGEEEVLAAGEG